MGGGLPLSLSSTPLSTRGYCFWKHRYRGWLSVDVCRQRPLSCNRINPPSERTRPLRIRACYACECCAFAGPRRPLLRHYSRTPQGYWPLYTRVRVYVCERESGYIACGTQRCRLVCVAGRKEARGRFAFFTLTGLFFFSSPSVVAEIGDLVG